MKTNYKKNKYGSRKGKKVFSRKEKKHNKKVRKTRKMKHRGGSTGLDQLGYGWKGSDLKTWPGMQGNGDSITRSNHLMVSPYGVPSGGVNMPHSTSGDITGNSSVPVPNCQYKYMGGYVYKKNSAKKNKMKGGYIYTTRKSSSRKSSSRKSSRRKSTKLKNQQRGGVFFQDVRNFGRYLANGVKTRINGVRGIEAPNGVMPTDQPYIDRDVKVIVSEPVDVEKIYLDNSNRVAKI